MTYQNKDPIIEVKNLSKHFGGIKAIEDVDMEVYDNEILAIVGDNGAGKSTLIKCISGVHKPTSGKILIEGKEVSIDGPDEAKSLGIETVYQSEGLIESLDVPENLFLGREKVKEGSLNKLLHLLDHNYMDRETDQTLERLQIQIEDKHEPVKNLSGGQRQATVVSRAVYWRNKIIILDEPANNLGVNETKNTLKMIKQLRDEYGLAVIVISHNLRHVFDLVDRIVVLKNGSKVGERRKEDTEENEIVSMITGLN